MTTTMHVEPDKVHFTPDGPHEWLVALARSLYLIAFGVSPIVAGASFGKDPYMMLTFTVPIGVGGILSVSEIFRARRMQGIELDLDETGIHVSKPGQLTTHLAWKEVAVYRWRRLGGFERFTHPERSGIELLGHDRSVLLFIPIPPLMRHVEPQVGRYREPKSCALAAVLTHLQAHSDPGMIPKDIVMSPEDRRHKIMVRSLVAVLVGTPGWVLMIKVLRHCQFGEDIPGILSAFVDSRLFWLPVLAATTGLVLALLAIVAAVMPNTLSMRKSVRAPTELSLHYARTGGAPADLRAEGQYRYAATAEVEPKLRTKVKEAKPGLAIVSVFCLGLPTTFVVSAATGNQTATFWTGVEIFSAFFAMLTLAFGGYWIDRNCLANIQDTITVDEAGILVQRQDGSTVRFTRSAKRLPLEMNGAELLVENGRRYVLKRALLKRSQS